MRGAANFFERAPAEAQSRLILDPGATVLAGFAQPVDVALLDALAEIARVAPFRQMVTPGGWQMSVAMTNCGDVGWVTDRTGYRYDANDPLTNRPWPPMPAVIGDLAQRAAQAAGFAGFTPDACLINRYAPRSRLSLHQDKNERDVSMPIVSVSLGVKCMFLWGGQSRSDRVRRIELFHGDVVVWGGPARMTYHGINPLPVNHHVQTGAFRYNLTLRKAR
ncbi:MAG TPA: DNA oxidative demethylase AlkB [Candidatus Acidoferrales bacterium]|nr:DNA oxidative demethylase AlkB [Candidatus Acidoferrales bacterium]